MSDSTPTGIAAKYVLGRVVSRREISPELWVVRVQPSEKISFQPGQYVTAGLPGPTRMIERPYSVVSSPEEPELEFFLELVPEGQLTPQLYQAPVGGEVFLRRAAKGRFLLDTASGHPNHFLVATVTGVAPYISMIRHRALVGGSSMLQLAVLQGASVPRELGYREELERLEAEHDWLRYIPTISRPWLEPSWQGERGRVEDVARKYLDAFDFTPDNTTVYVCGNPNMIENMKGLLKRAGFPKESVKEEVYWHAEKE